MSYHNKKWRSLNDPQKPTMLKEGEKMNAASNSSKAQEQV
jgi:hypothetical protein